MKYENIIVDILLNNSVQHIVSQSHLGSLNPLVANMPHPFFGLRLIVNPNDDTVRIRLQQLHVVAHNLKLLKQVQQKKLSVDANVIRLHGVKGRTVRIFSYAVLRVQHYLVGGLFLLLSGFLQGYAGIINILESFRVFAIPGKHFILNHQTWIETSHIQMIQFSGGVNWNFRSAVHPSPSEFMRNAAYVRNECRLAILILADLNAF